MFPKNFVEIYQVSQKIQIFTSSILTIFVNFMDFFNDVSFHKIISTAFRLGIISDMLLKNCINSKSINVTEWHLTL